MIITKQKPFEEILRALEGEQSVFLVGCAECATLCQTGGEEQVKEMQEKLEAAGKEVAGWVVLDPACHILEAKKELRKRKEGVGRASSLLVMACGVGTQAIEEATSKIVHPACDTLFLGATQRFGHFEEYCSLCGECVLDLTGGICPVTRCAKGLLNGPCGGAKNGKCEVDPEKDCAWVLICERLKEIGRLDNLISMPPQVKDYSKARKPARLILEHKGVAGQ